MTHILLCYQDTPGGEKSIIESLVQESRSYSSPVISHLGYTHHSTWPLFHALEYIFKSVWFWYRKLQYSSQIFVFTDWTQCLAFLLRNPLGTYIYYYHGHKIFSWSQLHSPTHSFFKEAYLFILWWGVFLGNKLALSRAQKILVPTSSTSNQIKKLFHIQEKTTVISNGVDLKKFLPVDKKTKLQLRKKVGIPAGTFVLLFVGKPWRAKGFDLLLEAVKTCTEYQLIVISPQGFSFPLESQTIRLVHSTSPPVMWYQLADLTVLPSENEQFPMTLLESLACGTPMLASSVGAIPHVLNTIDHNLLLSLRSSTQLSQKIQWFQSLNSKSKDKLRQKSRQTVESFSLQKTLDQLTTAVRTA